MTMQLTNGGEYQGQKGGRVEAIVRRCKWWLIAWAKVVGAMHYQDTWWNDITGFGIGIMCRVGCSVFPVKSVRFLWLYLIPFSYKWQNSSFL